jgi:hypothetical protein
MAWYWWLLIALFSLFVIVIVTLHIWSSIHGPNGSSRESKQSVDDVGKEAEDSIPETDAMENSEDRICSVQVIMHECEAVDEDLADYDLVYLVDGEYVDSMVPLHECMKNLDERKEHVILVSRFKDRSTKEWDLRWGVLMSVQTYLKLPPVSSFSMKHAKEFDCQLIECHTRPEFADIVLPR